MLTKHIRTRLLVAATLCGAWLTAPALAADDADDEQTQAKPVAAKESGAEKDQATKAAEQEDPKRKPLPLKLPKPAFKGTPKHVPPGLKLEKPRTKPREEFLAPPGVRNLAQDKQVTSSDDFPIIGELELVTDGDKAAQEGAYVELGPGLQWVQIDLKRKSKLSAIVTWRYHMNARVYFDVVVQVADDEDFIENVRTVFNNDNDNSAGLGIGRGLSFWETYEGHLIDAEGVEARYVRLYSRGSTADEMNHYTEVEVYGKPVE
jgi:hypothetical protein